VNLKKLSFCLLLSFVSQTMQAAMSFGSPIEKVTEIKIRQDKETGDVYLSITGMCEGQRMHEEFPLHNSIFDIGEGPAAQMDEAGHIKVKFLLRSSASGRYQILTKQELHVILMKPQELSSMRDIFSLQVNRATSELLIDYSVIRKATRDGSSAICFEYNPGKNGF
jgi:hypothetical protein